MFIDIYMFSCYLCKILLTNNVANVARGALKILFNNQSKNFPIALVFPKDINRPQSKHERTKIGNAYHVKKLSINSIISKLLQS